MAEKVETKKSASSKIGKTLNLCLSDMYDLEDCDNRRLYINCDIGPDIIDSTVYQILRFNRMDKGIPVKKRKPIVLYLNSAGGSEIDGFGLIDAITNSKTPVYTVNQAQCSSMAFLILIAGAKRFSMTHAQFLMHEGGLGTNDSTSKVRDRIDFMTGEYEEMIKEYVTNKTKITSELYDQKYRVEWYFLPEKAKELGVIDQIIGVDCDIDAIL